MLRQVLGRTGILDGANRPYRWDLARPDQLGTLVERAGDADLLRDWISLGWPVWHYFGDVQAKLTAGTRVIRPGSRVLGGGSCVLEGGTRVIRGRTPEFRLQTRESRLQARESRFQARLRDPGERDRQLSFTLPSAPAQDPGALWRQAITPG
ncbi:hypothetical protein CFP71_31090 [Amycolatopsis thailandensis]|uniref:Uncharacterized protein n=1 Tax=Amycolatopsis thailandensis TaxID=589330 RepID=A0A229RQS9_9PSEU|nr:hypothetical protein CFP71_31090 [Amycolatopsis thailandensis]